MTTPPQHGSRAQAIAALHAQYRSEPSKLSQSWQDFFQRLDADASGWLEGLAEPAVLATAAPYAASRAAPAPTGAALTAARDSLGAIMLIRAFRVRGHLAARLDPLDLAPREHQPDLDPKSYGFGENDLDRPIVINGQLGLETATLRQILEILRRDYCGSVGLEFMHMQDPVERTWIQDRIEGAQQRAAWKDEGRIQILERLTAAEVFERFLDKKYKGTKRFGLDGGESLLPALEMIVHTGAELGIEDITIGMSHRGRLNVLANLLQKPLEAIFSEFQGGSALPDDFLGAGDVKYHLGTSTDREMSGGKVHLSLTPNPSHLEAVDPVVVGRVRARQQALGDTERTRCMGLLLHGDAAFAGQGLVPETLQFCDLHGYRTGGVVHVIVNNQIGFTTSPVSGRSSPYCSDVAKMIQAPILHVNGDDPEAVVRAAGFAMSYRQTFRSDVVLDIYCYRRFGHNEGDEPAFTQPRMYKQIANHPTARESYAAKLKDEGIVDDAKIQALVDLWEGRFERAFERSKDYRATKADWLEGSWAGLKTTRGFAARRGKTGVAIDTLREVGAAITRIPEGFTANSKIKRQLRRKQEAIDAGEGIDWSTAEALSFGSLALEGIAVRLSGEDCGRGTFSQRHAAWIDQKNESRYVALDNIREGQARFEVVDSPLSEFGVLGFEYGYSLNAPRTLVLWEAQFGDFANGAQVICDQFISASEEKWLRMSGLVMLLPHGFEGQGPEHSSARLERFLQLCAEDNMQVVNCTTPANYFHVLRRQMHRPFRKPLIVMSPKSLLRHKSVVSTLAEMGPESRFRRVHYCDELPCEPEDAAQVVLCSGKVYYDLLSERDKRIAKGDSDAKRVHFLRLEQLYPLPADALEKLLAPYRHCRLVWCQEEPRNMGAWDYVKELILELAAGIDCEHPMMRYAGRESSASPATGLMRDHLAEQARLVDEALMLGVAPMGRIAQRKAVQAGRKRG